MKLPIIATACMALLVWEPAQGEKPKVYAVSDAHLDTQWNWDVQTTIKEHVWNTLNRNISLINRYPDYHRWNNVDLSHDAKLQELAAESPLNTVYRYYGTGDAYKSAVVERNMLSPDMIMGYSSYVNYDEAAAKLVDGDENTKWCDIKGRPAFVDFNLGKPTDIKGWRIVNAAVENPGYVTAGCYLLGKNAPHEEWRTLDFIGGNRQNILKRYLQKPEEVQYLRLMVTSPTQNPTIMDTRIYELEVF